MPHTRKKRGPAKPRLVKSPEFAPGDLLVAHCGKRTAPMPAIMAQHLVDNHSAEWVNHGTEIRVFRNTLTINPTIELTLAFMEGVVEGIPYHVKIWEMRQRSKGQLAA